MDITNNQIRVRTRLSPQKRKYQLMDIALGVFACRGIGRSGHADIAEIAKVSVATVFNYFPTKEDLVDEVLQHVVNQFFNFLNDNIDRSAHAKICLKNLTEKLCELALNHEPWLKIWFEWSASARDDIWPQYLTFNTESNRLVESIFTQAIKRGEINENKKPEELAKMYHATCYAIYLEANRAHDKEHMDKFTDNVLGMFQIYTTD